MKTLSSKSRLFIFVSIVAAFVLVAGLVWGLCGLSLSLDYSGGSQIKIICQEKADADQAQKLVKKTLKTNKVSVYQVERLSSGAEYQVVFKTKDKSVSNDVSVAVRDAVKDINLVEVQGFDEFDSTFKTPIWVIVLTTLGLGAVASFAAYFISKRWADALAFAIGFVANALLAFSLIVITRVEIGATSLAGLFLGLTIETAMSILVFVRIKNAQKRADNQDKQLGVIVSNVRKHYVLNDLFVYGVVMLGALLAVALGNTESIYFGVVLALSLASSVFVSSFLVAETKTELEDAFESRYEAKMSVPQTVVQVQNQKAKEKQKTKTERPTSQKPSAKKTNKKRKRRNPSNKNKVVV